MQYEIQFCSTRALLLVNRQLKVLFFQSMVSRSFDDFLLAFGQANAFVFNSTAQMQSAAKNMWADIKDRPDEVEAFIKEVNSESII